MSIGFEYVFVSGHNCTARCGGINPGRQRVCVVVGNSRIARTERSSSSAVAVEPGNIAAELNEALAVQARCLLDLARRKTWRSRHAWFFGRRSVFIIWTEGIHGRSRTFGILHHRNLRREITVE